MTLDVTDPEQAEAAVQAAVARFGRLNVLVNNAGYGQLGHFETVDREAIALQFDTNVLGLLHVTRAALPVMRRQRSGRLLNLSSIGGLVGFEGAAIYCATKFAVEGFSESLAPEVRPFGIRVTVVEPWFLPHRLPGRAFGPVRLARDRRLRGGCREAARDLPRYSHRQPGDPAKLGRALVYLSRLEDPLLRYLAGTDAQMAEASLAARGAELNRMRDLSASTDHPAAA